MEMHHLASMILEKCKKMQPSKTKTKKTRKTLDSLKFFKNLFLHKANTTRIQSHHILMQKNKSILQLDVTHTIN